MTEAVLAIDLGGTKTLAALVRDGRTLEVRRVATPRGLPPERLLDAATELAGGWEGRFGRVAVAVTGRVANGSWSAVNPAVLAVEGAYPLVEAVRARWRVPVTALNDAQAAAWGEYRFGAGRGLDVAFVTVSTGVGGGFVCGGRLLVGGRGLAGHVGRLRCGIGPGAVALEDVASGGALGRDGAPFGAADAEAVFAAAGAEWAETLVDRAAEALAGACASLQALVDPDRIVLGGGVGLAPGFAERVRRHLDELPDALRPEIATAALGVEAGLVGVADYALVLHGS